jgi:hypothetical protein
LADPDGGGVVAVLVAKAVVGKYPYVTRTTTDRMSTNQKTITDRKEPLTKKMKKVKIMVTESAIPTPAEMSAFSVVVGVVTAGVLEDIPCLFLEAIIE